MKPELDYNVEIYLSLFFIQLKEIGKINPQEKKGKIHPQETKVNIHPQETKGKIHPHKKQKERFIHTRNKRKDSSTQETKGKIHPHKKQKERFIHTRNKRKDSSTQETQQTFVTGLCRSTTIEAIGGAKGWLWLVTPPDRTVWRVGVELAADPGRPLVLAVLPLVWKGQQC